MQEKDKMSMEGFLKCVRLDLEQKLGTDYLVEIHRVVKINDTVLHGITARKEKETIAPTIYLNNAYADYLMGKTSLADVEAYILENMDVHMDKCNKTEIGRIMDFESIKGNIYYRLVSLERNKEYLKDVPYIPFLDMAVVFYYLVFEDVLGVASGKITYQELSHWGISVDELYDTAKENTPGLFPVCMEPLMDAIIKQMGDVPPDGLESAGCNMYILTNQKGLNGAAAILYDGVLEKYAYELDCDFYILPSSIHETMLVPVEETDEGQLPFLKGMVREANATAVMPMDLLTDSVYRYDWEQNKIFIM